ncbi:hypothetical protein SAMN05216302_102643 [Nitrosomonas aestuarii]|uniref:Uncharacterized protein n=1 Tax=Nitrosomonas aestuarii TaxID=52441 RepID=A0A1I4EBE9_9PROT|nr:hypothetical protein [Nitrosomonas aestuarii]SFL01716.1 hypothetical protein SAMN05216302_102643 [Nitrosomonas aestuarii]
MESPSQDESQKVKLKRNLIKQFARDELNLLTDKFLDRFSQDNPFLEKNIEKIIEYLVDTQRNEKELLRAIAVFLQIAGEFSYNQIEIELAKDLFAYLLQTLVNESKTNTGGMNHVSVNYIPTVKLIYAAEKGIAVVPDYENLEYKAGKRNARFENIGDFQSRNAKWTVDSVCEEIAEKILSIMRETHRSPKGPLHTLKGKLIHTEIDPSKSPLHGIFIESEYLSKHPFNTPQVLQHFMKMTDGRLPVYVYRVDEVINGHRNLKIDEEDLRGFLSIDYELLKKSLEVKSTNFTTDSVQSVNIFGNIEKIDINQNFVSLNQDGIEQLQHQISQLSQQIELATNLTKQDRDKITHAVQIVEHAMQNPGKIDKKQLSDAGRIFELYVETFSFAASIFTIIQFLLT